MLAQSRIDQVSLECRNSHVPMALMRAARRQGRAGRRDRRRDRSRGDARGGRRHHRPRRCRSCRRSGCSRAPTAAWRRCAARWRRRSSRRWAPARPWRGGGLRRRLRGTGTGRNDDPDGEQRGRAADAAQDGQRLAHHLHRREPQHAEARPDGARGWHLYPMAFLVEKDPHAVTKPHFHEADQYQVVVQGGGRLGTHDVGTVAVHYTDAWSAYGPIVAADEGISWFTLRNTWDSGARYMPAAREQLRAARVRNFQHREATARRCRLPRPAELARTDRAVLRHRARADAGRHGDMALPPAAGCTRQRARSERGRRTVLDRAVRLRFGGRAAFLPPNSCVFVAPEMGR